MERSVAREKEKPQHSWYVFSLAAGSTYRLSWQVCWRCGLVRMNNEATQKRIRAGCSGDTSEG
jgi:hypothetical protein